MLSCEFCYAVFPNTHSLGGHIGHCRKKSKYAGSSRPVQRGRPILHLRGAEARFILPDDPLYQEEGSDDEDSVGQFTYEVNRLCPLSKKS